MKWGRGRRRRCEDTITFSDISVRIFFHGSRACVARSQLLVLPELLLVPDVGCGAQVDVPDGACGGAELDDG